MVQIRLPLLYSVFEKYSSLIIQFVASLIVARLLSPTEFGVFAVAFSIVGFTQAVREMGVNSYIIQKDTITCSDIRACLFVTVAISLAMAFLLTLLLPLIGRVYGDDVRTATSIMTANLLLMPVSSTIFAVLQREMRFDLLLRINIAGSLANAGCTIGLAASGWGYLSLAWGCVAGLLTNTAVAAAYRPHRQHFSPSYVGAAGVFRFGSVLMLGTLLSQVSTNIANLITARFVNLEAMGLFSRAQSVSGLFSRLIMDGIQPILLPLFSQFNRTNADLGVTFVQTFSYLGVVVWPFVGFISICSQQIIVVMFGDQWQEAAFLLQAIAIGGVFWIIPSITNPALVAMGRVNRILRIQVINQLFALFGVLLAAMHGIEAVAIAVIPISAAHAAVWLYYTYGIVGLSARSMIRAACVCAVVTGIALAIPIIVILFCDHLLHLERLILAGSGCVVGWLAGIAFCRHPLGRELLRALSFLREARLRRTGV